MSKIAPIVLVVDWKVLVCCSGTAVGADHARMIRYISPHLGPLILVAPKCLLYTALVYIFCFVCVYLIFFWRIVHEE